MQFVIFSSKIRSCSILRIHPQNFITTLHHFCRIVYTTCLALAMAMTHTKECVFFGTTRYFGTQILFIYYYKNDTNIRKHLLQCNRLVTSKDYFQVKPNFISSQFVVEEVCLKTCHFFHCKLLNQF